MIYQSTIYLRGELYGNKMKCSSSVSEREQMEGVGRMTEKDIPLTEAVYYILLAVRKPNHGYGIIQEVGKLTNGRVVLGAGTLYGAIQTLQKKKWIDIYSVDTESRKKKEYIITDTGKEVFEAERTRLEELLRNAALMKGEQGEE